MCLLNSVISHNGLKRVFKNQTVLSKMSPLCRTERVKAKSSKFFLQEAVLGRRLLQVGGCKCRRNCDARGSRPPDFDRNQKKTCYIKISWSQWISLLYRRVQKMKQIKPDHCNRYQNNCTKNAIEWHWSHTSE